MDSDLRAAMAGHVTQQEAYARSSAGSAPLTAGEFHWAMNALARREVVMTVQEAEAAAKAQRRADLVTLTGHALSGLLANPAYEGWSLEISASNAVLVAEKALAIIEGRVK